MALSPNEPAYTGINGGTGGGGSGSVTSNQFSALEVRVSALSTAPAGVSVTSTELSNVLSVANAASNAASIVSQGLSALSQANSADHASIRGLISTVSTAASNALSVANAASNAASIVSTAASNALSAAQAASNHASVASDAATSVNARVNSVNTFISGISARSVGDVSTHGLQSVINALSNRISANSGTGGGGGSVTSQEFSVLSAIVQIIAGEQGNITTLLNNVSARSVGGSSVHGLQSAINALSNRISATPGGSGSVTSNELSAASAQAQSAINVVSNAVSIVSTAASNALSVANAASNAASIVSTAASNALSVANAASNAASIVSVAVSVLSQANSVDHASIRGLISTVSTAASNALSVANAASQAASVVSTAASNALSAAQAASNHASAASDAATSVNNRVNSVNTFISGISSRSVGNVSTHGLQSVIDALSNRISANSGVGGGASVTSNEFSALEVRVSALCAAPAGVSVTSTELSAVSHNASVNNASIMSIINTVSIQDVFSGLGSVQGLKSVVSTIQSNLNQLAAGLNNTDSAISVIRPLIRKLNASVVISAAALTDITGFSFPVSAGVAYDVMMKLVHHHSAAGAGFGLGGVWTAMNAAGGKYWGMVSIVAAGASTYLSTVRMEGQFNENASGSVVYSAAPGASGTNYFTFMEALFVASVTGSVQFQARSSAGTVGAVHFRTGSFLKVLRLG